jgi:hypothetical protein
MRDQGLLGMRVVDVADLGEECVIVELKPQPLLLLDANLNCDQRLKILARIMAEECA